MATDITQKEAGVENASKHTLMAELNEVELTPEQRSILGQVYQLILSWRPQPVQNVEQGG